jgi:hypothetical protein
MRVHTYDSSASTASRTFGWFETTLSSVSTRQRPRILIHAKSTAAFVDARGQLEC